MIGRDGKTLPADLNKFDDSKIRKWESKTLEMVLMVSETEDDHDKDFKIESGITTSVNIYRN